MIRKFTYGCPFQTEAVVTAISPTLGELPYFQTDYAQGLSFLYQMNEKDIIYGLGESNRGLNKRGYRYVSNCTDISPHTENLESLYAAHNFLLVKGTSLFGLFVDAPQKLTFDIGYTDYNELVICSESQDMDIYLIEEDSLLKIVHSFRLLIGESYIPPRWAFGYQQSRWGYTCEEDFYKVADQHEQEDIPLDAIYMDIDYMERYKDFTVDENAFPHFDTLVSDMKKRNIKLVPIIDAGVKIEKGYETYEEGIANGYFCTDQEDKPFVAAVWPGKVHFPDVLNPAARLWFGKKYSFLINKGIEGFWNDMNEPAIFYSEEGLKKAFDDLDALREKEIGIHEYFAMSESVLSIANNPADYERFYHSVNGEKVVHAKVHNIFGYNMTRAASEGFDAVDSSKRFLLFSRSSYIGMHRYGGIWTGDNSSWWQHLLLNIKMMPSLNMCGFLYAGADLGGFGSHTTYDLLVRWLQFGIFTPLMRNHASQETREQELYQFFDSSYFRELLRLRYSLIPYLYSEYIKAAKNSTMLFSPLSFTFSEDEAVNYVEDQLLFSSELMLAPVYTQNAGGRYVYLPDDMLLITFSKGEARNYKILEQGHHYLDLALEEFPLFLRKNQFLPLCRPANSTEALCTSCLELIGFAADCQEMSYSFYEDDGYTKNITSDHAATIVLKKENNSWSASSDEKNISFFSITVIEK